jgi:hypothetical protein
MAAFRAVMMGVSCVRLGQIGRELSTTPFFSFFSRRHWPQLLRSDLLLVNHVLRW